MSVPAAELACSRSSDSSPAHRNPRSQSLAHALVVSRQDGFVRTFQLLNLALLQLQAELHAFCVLLRAFLLGVRPGNLLLQLRQLALQLRAASGAR